MQLQKVNTEFDFKFINVSALIIKVTNKCNVDCSYCYENVSKVGDTMPIETFKSLATKAIVSSINEKITFIFHGGEPTLVSLEWYNQAIDFCRQLAHSFAKVVEFNLQTNLISVNDNKLLALKGLGIRICASIDTFTEYSNSQRAFSIKTLANFHRAKALGIPISVLSTINRSNFNSFGSFMDYLQNNLHVTSFKANIAYPVGSSTYSSALSPEEIFEAKKSIIEHMLINQGIGVNEVNALKQIQRYFTPIDECEKELCDKRTCGAGKTVLGINHKGDILPCGRFSWNDESYYLGNVNDLQKSQDAVFTKITSEFHSAEASNWTNCNECKAKTICNFGCQAFILRSKGKINIECKATQLLYDYFDQNKTAIKILAANTRKVFAWYNDGGSYTDNYSDYSDSHE